MTALAQPSEYAAVAIMHHQPFETGRIAIESTSRLLKRLELPDLKTEEQAKADGELRLETDRESGGGYDPYNQPTRGRTRR